MLYAENVKSINTVDAEYIRIHCAGQDTRHCPGLLEKLVDDAADMRYRMIHEAPDTVSSDKTIWYVSNKGRADAMGDSPDDPFDSLASLEANRNRISSGDAVLFARGEEFRGDCVVSVSGVSYGAYGKGEKPILNASLRNHISDNWYSPGEDMWTCDAVFPADVGNIVFNSGERVGYKKLKREDISDYFDFYSDHEKGNAVFIKLPGDPRRLFSSIEIAYNIWLFRLEQNSDITVENLAFTYGGGHAIRGGDCADITVRGCEFRYIGGSYLTGYKDGTVRYGNAVEFMRGCRNILVENCYAYEIYDSGATHQGLGDYCAENIIFRNNLFSHCGMGCIEYWLGEGSLAKDVSYEGNILRFAGYGFGGKQRPDKNATAHIQGNGFLHNHIENFKICNNIFDRSTYDLLNTQSIDETLPELFGNIYIQNSGQRLGSWGAATEKTADSGAEATVLNDWNDLCGITAIIE